LTTSVLKTGEGIKVKIMVGESDKKTWKLNSKDTSDITNCVGYAKSCYPQE